MGESYELTVPAEHWLFLANFRDWLPTVIEPPMAVEFLRTRAIEHGVGLFVWEGYLGNPTGTTGTWRPPMGEWRRARDQEVLDWLRHAERTTEGTM